MNKPVLVVMAAGMGSRYGGMKQIDPVGPCGQVIVDYSLYDARRAGQHHHRLWYFQAECRYWYI